VVVKSPAKVILESGDRDPFGGLSPDRDSLNYEMYCVKNNFATLLFGAAAVSSGDTLVSCVIPDNSGWRKLA